MDEHRRSAPDAQAPEARAPEPHAPKPDPEASKPEDPEPDASEPEASELEASELETPGARVGEAHTREDPSREGRGPEDQAAGARVGEVRVVGEAVPEQDAAWMHPLQGRLLRAQRRSRAFDRRHPWTLDAVVVLLVAAANVPILIASTSPNPDNRYEVHLHLPLGVRIALTVLIAVALWWRRRAPAAAFAAVLLLGNVQWPLDAGLQIIVAVLVGLYNLALRAPVRIACWGFVLLVAETALGTYLFARETSALSTIASVAVIAFGVFALAFTFRTRREYLAALEERATRLETERHQRAQLAAAAERARVAREMHDILGHNLSVMVGLADGGAALAASGNERAEQPLRLIGDTARQALGELRRLLDVLREGPEDARLAPQPGVAELEAQLARVCAAGLRVTYHTEGDLDALGSGVQLTVYRIVQEALTNTLKHAGAGTTAEVSVTTGNGTVRVRVADEGPPPGAGRRTAPGAPGAPGAPDGEPGHGLVGIRQRAALYGGTVTAGPRAGGGWIVDVLLEPGAAADPRREPGR